MSDWKIIYDEKSKALEMLYSTVQSYVNYSVICIQNEKEEQNTISLKTDKSIKGYKISAKQNKIEITGQDSTNLLYAVSDFKNKFIPFWKNPTHKASKYLKPFNDKMPDFELCTKPKIEKRGIWTWGHVIYDYKAFIDNMVVLRLNTLIIWNDFVPVNIDKVIEYAHQNGIYIYLGFAWGWDQKCDETIKNTDGLSSQIAEKYKSEYAHVDCDGIYFQTFTELNQESVDGIDIAKAATELVNSTAELIFKINPKLEILFGLHATSVKNKLDVIANTDSRIKIMWEDLGAFPYGYIPSNIEGFDETFELQSKIKKKFNHFAAVLKGVGCLDWSLFEHQKGPFIMGECDKHKIDKKLCEKKDLLRYIQAHWIKNAKYAHKIIKEFSQNDIITVLCEDCVFERVINYPMAIYASMLWDPDRDTDDILSEVALMQEVDFI